MKIKDQLRMQELYASGAFAKIELGASAVPQSPDDIDALSKGEVREWLEAHGVEPEKGAKVADMKDALTRIMFVEPE